MFRQSHDNEHHGGAVGVEKLAIFEARFRSEVDFHQPARSQIFQHLFFCCVVEPKTLAISVQIAIVFLCHFFFAMISNHDLAVPSWVALIPKYRRKLIDMSEKKPVTNFQVSFCNLTPRILQLQSDKFFSLKFV